MSNSSAHCTSQARESGTRLLCDSATYSFRRSGGFPADTTLMLTFQPISGLPQEAYPVCWKYVHIPLLHMIHQTNHSIRIGTFPAVGV